MLKFYTPSQWSSVFNHSPSLIIDDDGYIYSADDYESAFRRKPIGKVDYERDHIYGSDYDRFSASPIGYIVRTDYGEIRIYDRSPGMFTDPILYIKDDTIYSADEYGRLFPNAGGYIEHEPKNDDDTSRSSGNAGYNGEGCLGALVFISLMILTLLKIKPAAIIFVAIYLLSSLYKSLMHGISISFGSVLVGLIYGVITFVAVYGVLFLISDFGVWDHKAYSENFDAYNQIAAWIAFAGTFIGQQTEK